MLKKNIKWIFLGLILVACIFPFLRLSEKIYLVGFREVLSVGPYKVNAHVFLSDYEGIIDAGGYFTYRTQSFSGTRCLLEVSLKSEGEKFISGIQSEKRQLWETDSCNSLERHCPEGSVIDDTLSRLNLLVPDISVQDLTYNFQLSPENGIPNKNCEASTAYTHKVLYRRISYYDRYMSVRHIQWFEKYLPR